MTDNRDGMGAGVCWGSLAATIALALQLPLLDNGPLAEEHLAFLPAGLVILLVTLVATLAIVGFAALVIGLPVVALLGRVGCDGAEVLALAGGLAGYGVIWAFVLATVGPLDSDGSVFALAAMAGGAVLGAVWGHAQEEGEQDEPL